MDKNLIAKMTQRVVELKRDHKTLQSRMALRAQYNIQAFVSEMKMFNRVAQVQILTEAN